MRIKILAFKHEAKRGWLFLSVFFRVFFVLARPSGKKKAAAAANAGYVPAKMADLVMAEERVIQAVDLRWGF